MASRGVYLSGQHYAHTYLALEDRVLSKIKEKLNTTLDVSQDSADAAFLTMCFNDAKNLIMSIQSGQEAGTIKSSLVNDEIIQRISPLFEKGAGSGVIGMFKYSGKSSNIGASFERDITKVAYVLAQGIADTQVPEIIQKTWTVRNFKKAVVGNKTAGLRETEAIQYLAELQSKNQAIGSTISMEARDIKTDVDFSKTKDLLLSVMDYAPNANLQRFFDIIANRGSFTAKNYFLSSLKKFGLNLGSSKNKKWFFGTMVEAGVSAKDQSILSIALDWHFRRYSGLAYHADTLSTLQRMKFAYELAGLGQDIQKLCISMPRFLILNIRDDTDFKREMASILSSSTATRIMQNKSESQAYGYLHSGYRSGEILVYSTAALILDYFESLSDMLSGGNIAFKNDSLAIDTSEFPGPEN